MLVSPSRSLKSGLLLPGPPPGQLTCARTPPIQTPPRLAYLCLDSSHLDPPGRLTCALFTCEGQVIVAGDIIPLALLVPDHHHTVLSGGKEVVRLVGAPVLKLLCGERGRGEGKAGALWLGLTPTFFPVKPLPSLPSLLTVVQRLLGVCSALLWVTWNPRVLQRTGTPPSCHPQELRTARCHCPH